MARTQIRALRASASPTTSPKIDWPISEVFDRRHAQSRRAEGTKRRHPPAAVGNGSLRAKRDYCQQEQGRHDSVANESPIIHPRGIAGVVAVR